MGSTAPRGAQRDHPPPHRIVPVPVVIVGADLGGWGSSRRRVARLFGRGSCLSAGLTCLAKGSGEAGRPEPDTWALILSD
jgi:hypothetical protein